MVILRGVLSQTPNGRRIISYSSVLGDALGVIAEAELRKYANAKDTSLLFDSFLKH